MLEKISAKGGSASGGKKFSRRIANRENITAIGIMVAIGGVIAIMMGTVYFFERYNGTKAQKESRHNAYEDEIRRLSGITTNLESVPDPTANWKNFDGAKYNFSLKYPTNWNVSENANDPRGKYLDKISFSDTSAGNQGFDIYVYDSGKFSDPKTTDNLEKINQSASTADCPAFDEITLGQDKYSAKEINITAGNPCWKETFFFSISRGSYTYNIVPRSGSNFDVPNFDEKVSLVKILPEFYDVVSTISISDQSTQVGKMFQASKKIYTEAAQPRVRFTAGGSCAHKNDHPSYSKKGKGKHMDEDCCPDPDEWPNPGCAYSGSALSLMLGGPPAKKKG